jgi:hypothetical protein
MMASIHSRAWATKRPLSWLCAYRWRVGIRRRTNRQLVTGRLDEFTFIQTPIGHFHADPFVIEYEDRIFLFFEDYSYLNRSANLACAELDQYCNVLETRTIVQQPYHMSYPHVFEFDGSYYMMPETAAVNRVELYRAVNFPWEWKFERVLLSGMKLHDATLVQFGGKHWILAGGSSTGASGNYDQLHVFHASTIFDCFTPHRANPVKTDLQSSRPAGGFVMDGDRLIRPAQDCSRWYGSGLTLMGVDELSESAYAEHPFASPPGSWLGGSNLGTHTYNVSEHFEVIDVCSYGVEVAAMIGRVRSLAKVPDSVCLPRGRREEPLVRLRR